MNILQKMRAPLLFPLVAVAGLAACAGGQQATYKLGLFDPHLRVLCRVYLNMALTNAIDIQTSAAGCRKAVDSYQGWSMEAFVEQDGKLVPAAQYLEQGRRSGTRQTDRDR
jgi:hypothetical protein